MINPPFACLYLSLENVHLGVYLERETLHVGGESVFETVKMNVRKSCNFI